MTRTSLIRSRAAISLPLGCDKKNSLFGQAARLKTLPYWAGGIKPRDLNYEGTRKPNQTKLLRRCAWHNKEDKKQHLVIHVGWGD